MLHTCAPTCVRVQYTTRRECSRPETGSRAHKTLYLGLDTDNVVRRIRSAQPPQCVDAVHLRAQQGWPMPDQRHAMLRELGCRGQRKVDACTPPYSTQPSPLSSVSHMGMHAVKRRVREGTRVCLASPLAHNRTTPPTAEGAARSRTIRLHSTALGLAAAVRYW